MKSRYLLLAFALALLLPGMTSVFAGDVKLTFDHYYDGPAVAKAVQDLNKGYPNLTEVQVIGITEEGRDIWQLTINNPKTGSDLEKPGIYVDGAIHGNEIQATEVCLYLAWYLLDSYDSNEMIKKLVDSLAFYIIPTVNVDNRSRFFSEAGGYNIGRTAMVPYDDDGDGLADEDDAEDIDGDGEILQMRIRDPFGNWKTSPDDPRVMVRVKPGEWGEWRKLGEEGIDNDGDGRINEDGPGYLDMNRNYGFKWQPPYVQAGAGDYPMSSKPTKAISDFVKSKPNLCFNVAFHNSGGLIVRGPGSKLAGRYARSDIKVYDFLGHEGEKIIPGYEYIIGGVDMYTTHGDFDEWMFSNNGIFGFVGELFMSSQEQYRPPPEDGEKPEDDDEWYGGTRDVEKHKFDDFVNQGTLFSEWKKFNHPQFGEIEIGGWSSYSTRIPPTFLLPEMVHRNASLIIFIASHAPEVELSLIDVKDLGGGLKRIRVRAANNHALPTLSQRAISKKIYRQDMFTIKGRGIEVVSGGIVTDIHYEKFKPKEHKPEIIFSRVPSFGTQEVQWIVKGSGQATITFEALKATNRTLTVKL